MPRPRQAQGRPGTQVIPHDWETMHRPVVEKTMTGTAALAKPGTEQAWDPETDQNVAVPMAPYDEGVPCRVQELVAGAREQVAAEDTEAVATYLVVIPARFAPREDDLVTVSATGDPALDGQTLRILRVERGTQRFERDLFCTLTT